ncbi:MAG: hypothetical protein ACYCSS_12620 [Sulfuriferula sp.]
MIIMVMYAKIRRLFFLDYMFLNEIQRRVLVVLHHQKMALDAGKKVLPVANYRYGIHPQ